MFQTGHIRTASGNYFIEPVEKIGDHVTPALHSIYRANPSAAGQNDSNGLPDQKSHQPEQNCGVQGKSLHDSTYYPQ